jgi:glycosyltransferase involved in cell wall biosynthesis
MSGLRVVVVDDAPYLSWAGRTYAANATFHRFAAALLDVRGPDGAPVIASLALAVPVRAAAAAPESLPVDGRIRVIATAPFDGIAGYLRRAPFLAAQNAPRLRTAMRRADVVLLRLPGSNGLLAALAAVARGVPRVGYVVGSVRDVVAGQGRGGFAGVGAQAVAAGYDGATRLATAGSRVVVAGAGLAHDGVVSSLVEPDEILERLDDPWPAWAGGLRLVYAGRLAEGKGLDTLLEAVAVFAASVDAPAIRLDLVGDGPARGTLRDRAIALGIVDRVAFAGHLAGRAPYLAALAAADVFVSASPAEGFPKAVLDAMAAGLPIVAVPAGRLAELIDPETTALGAPILPVPPGDASAIATALADLAAQPDRARALRAAGRAFVAEHTMPAEAARLAVVLRSAADGARRR